MTIKTKSAPEKQKKKIYQRFVKRPMDLILSFCALIILSPLLVIVAILVRINLGSPILFKQQRPGHHEKIFTIYKFRTMREDRNEKGELLPDSERLTKFGRMLRNTSIDELPELLNVLKGEMSLIGPRPLLIQYLPYYTGNEKSRHSIRPGISGLAQINGRNTLDWNSRLLVDIQYEDNINCLSDIKIFIETVIKIFMREGITVIDLAPLKNLDVERSSHIADKEFE